MMKMAILSQAMATLRQTMATLSNFQHGSFMPDFDSNDTQATHKGPKEVPKLQNEDPKAPFLMSKLFNCEMCSASYRNKQTLKTHMEKSHKVKLTKISCKFCDVSYKFTKNLKCHMEKHKENHSQEIISQENVQPAVPINTVFMGTLDSKDLEGKKMHNCTHCGKDFNLKSNLTRHVKILHNDVGVMHNCTHCGKDFNFKCNLSKGF